MVVFVLPSSSAAQSTPTRTPTPSPSPTPFSLLATPTSYVASSECPVGTWDSAGLSPRWVAACSHCLARPTATRGPFDQVVIPTVSFPTLTLPQPTYVCPTATLTQTSTPTLVGTPPQYCAYWSFLGSAVSGPAWPSLYIDQGTLTASGLSGIRTTQGSQQVRRADVGVLFSSPVTLLSVTLWGSSSLSWSSALYSRSATSVWTTLSSWVNQSASSSLLRSWTGSLPSVEAFGNLVTAWGFSPSVVDASSLFMTAFQVCWTGTPPPTSTPLPQPTCGPSPTPTLTATVAPPFFLSADCRNPEYVSHQPVVSFDFQFDGSQCYAVFPRIYLQLPTIPLVNVSLPTIDIPRVDLCLQFYRPYFSVVGLVLDLSALVSAGLALLLMRWALFN